MLSPANRKPIVIIALVAVGLAGLLAMFAASRLRLPQVGGAGFALSIVAFAFLWLSLISVWFERVGGARWRAPGAAAFASSLNVEVGAQAAERAAFPKASARL